MELLKLQYVSIFFFIDIIKIFSYALFFILNNSFFPQLYFFFCFKSVGDGGSAKKSNEIFSL